MVNSHLERVATWLSLACAVHCLVMPIALSALPLLGSSGFTRVGSSADLLLTLLVVASALAGSAWGYRRHRDSRIVIGTGVGLATYLLGHLFERAWYGVGLAVAGALVLAASSFISARLSHADADCVH